MHSNLHVGNYDTAIVSCAAAGDLQAIPKQNNNNFCLALE